MAVIFKFPNKRKQYSEDFLKGIDPNKIGDFIQAQNPGLSTRAADAMALAVIYSTYLQLVFDEEGEKVPVNVMRKFEENDHDTFMWHGSKRTLH